MPKDEKRSLFRELGLPYVSDPAVTRHLNAFLEPTGQAPDAILFNGGFFIPEILRERVADVVGHWYGRRPRDLREHAISIWRWRAARPTTPTCAPPAAACWCAAVCRAPTTSASASRATASSPPSAWCRAAPRKARPLEIDNDALQLVANRPVSFRLYSSLTRTDDKLGEVVEFAAGDPDLHMHAPLNAVIRFGKKAEERLIPVKLGARLTEIGTLETWCESKISDNRWRLQFELRKQAAAAAGRAQGRRGGQRSRR